MVGGGGDKNDNLTGGTNRGNTQEGGGRSDVTPRWSSPTNQESQRRKVSPARKKSSLDWERESERTGPRVGKK